ncbi:MAG: FAD binding domain-containing protein [Deltaproteobacteria bacterium]|nr:FAD binding domain-containing protein [Deltaproteobacteria bacterium]
MLRLPPVAVLRPRSLPEALATLSCLPEPLILGGGTDLLVALKQGHGARSGGLLRLLSLGDLPLADLREEEGGWTLGAGVTLWDLERWHPPGPLSVISDAARQIAAPPIRSRATLGGNLCLDTRCFHYNQSTFWRSSRPACFKAGGEVCHVAPGGNRCFACHQADLPPVLIALGATACLQNSQAARTAPVEALYTGTGKTPLALARGELVTAVSIPRPPPRSGASWEKIRMRKGLDFAVASAAAYVETAPDGSCRLARVVLGAVGPGPLRVAEAEDAVRGRPLGADLLETVADAARRTARPMKNGDLPPAYRRQVAGVAAKRAVEKAWQLASAPR